MQNINFFSKYDTFYYCDKNNYKQARVFLET